MTERPRKKIAIYLRVSSDDQRDRQTILTQRAAVEQFLALTDEALEVYDWYIDDGVSGTIPMSQRPSGRRLMEDAKQRKFAEVFVYKIDRLGRDNFDPLIVWRDLEAHRVGVRSITEGIRTIFEYHIRVAMAAEERRTFLERSAAGMDRAAREGRYTGGIVPLGYKVEGHKETARLVPDDGIIWGDWTAADLIRRIYYWLGVEGRSCRWIALELTALGVPTSYRRDGRGVRGKRTQGIWRPGVIRNRVVNPIYKGESLYGRRRSKKSKRTHVIEALVPVPALVSLDLWDAAQGTLAHNRLLAKNSERVYLLRGVIRCGLCGLAFCGATGRPGVWWYRCNGYLAERGGKDKRCQAKAIRNTDIEEVVWRDIEALLRNPGELLASLRAEMENRGDDEAALAEAERITLEAALGDLDGRRGRTLDMYEHARISGQELDARLDQIEDERRKLAARLDALRPPEPKDEPIPADLMVTLAQRLDAGLTDEERSEIVRLLVRRITVHTTVIDDRNKAVNLSIEYRFSDPGCSPTRNGMGSWHSPA